MQRKGIHAMHSSIALTLLSLAECVTYIVASFLGDYLKDRLVYVNVAASGALAVICIVWPLIDVNYEMILVISLGRPICNSTLKTRTTTVICMVGLVYRVL